MEVTGFRRLLRSVDPVYDQQKTKEGKRNTKQDRRVFFGSYFSRI